jgi:uncharacterized protein (DUF488 family)
VINLGKIYTIGHSNLAVSDFIKLLEKFKIKFLLDVRSSPGSAYNDQFNMDELKAKLIEEDIAYIYLGKGRGGRQEVPFKKYSQTEGYLAELNKIERVAERGDVVLMCSEADFMKCHRKLISNSLTKRGYETKHILKDGKVVENQVIEMLG